MIPPDRANKTPLVWVDCEMTGLDPAVDELVEVAVIVTDSMLHPLAEGIDILIKPSDEALEQMTDFVREMHTSSGLLDQLANGVSLEEAEKQVLEYIKSIVPNPGIAPLAGNSIGQDQRFLRAYMPNVTDHLHYRIIDVSTIKELAKRWYPRVYVCAPDKNGGHRALADIQDSIVELEYYRRALFPQELNPESGFYHHLAADVVEEAKKNFAEFE
ncbi:oligoribonuclease [Actinomycetaceae bacterium MB13-C1-2]|nr:oligoribonuclease [Actinomycetaceae bacterium MB13-C1-2]